VRVDFYHLTRDPADKLVPMLAGKSLSGSEQQAEQPILISDQCEPANGAPYIILSDGLWRDEALAFERAFFLFTAEQIDHARTVGRDLKAKDEVTPRYWKQDGGRWVEGP
jgi:DNA polymerase-3 subunit chi